MAATGAGRKSGGGEKFPAFLVEQMQHAIGNCEIGSAQSEAAVRFLFLHARKGPKIGKAHLDGSHFQNEQKKVLPELHPRSSVRRR